MQKQKLIEFLFIRFLSSNTENFDHTIVSAYSVIITIQFHPIAPVLPELFNPLQRILLPAVSAHSGLKIDVVLFSDCIDLDVIMKCINRNLKIELRNLKLELTTLNEKSKIVLTYKNLWKLFLFMVGNVNLFCFRLFNI